MNRYLTVLLLSLIISIPAFAQDKGYDVHAYDAKLHLNRPTDSLWGEVVMSATATTSLKEVTQQFLKYLSIDSVFVDGNPGSVVPLDTTSGEYAVSGLGGAPLQIPRGATFTVRTVYHGNPRPEQYLKSPWGGVTVEDSMMFAMGVGFATPYTSTTRHWLPSYDLPDDKADSITLTFFTDSNEVVASNGLESIAFNNVGRVTTWKENRPIATYLMTFAVGPYTTLTLSTMGAPITQIFALNRDSASIAKTYQDIIYPSAEFFDSLFAPYPFQKIGYVVTPIGSMEHQTMISLDKAAIGDSWTNTTPSHELAHQWWGDWVTCKTFDDAWLNESFATFCQDLLAERFIGHQSYLDELHAAQRYEVRLDGKNIFIDPIPIYGAGTWDNHTNNYPNSIYTKGALVLAMLRSYLGDSTFFKSIRNYGAAHAYSTATTADIQNAFESTSGQNLDWVFQQFVYARGAAVADLHYAIAGHSVALALTQVQDSLGYRFFRMPLEIEARSNGQTERSLFWLDSTEVTNATVNFSFTPDTIVVDPDGMSLMIVRKVTQATDASVMEGSTEAQFSVYPNPAESAFHVRLQTEAPLYWKHIQLFDPTGRCVFQRQLDSLTSLLDTKLDPGPLSRGQYIVLVSADHGIQFSTRVTLD